MFIPFQFNRIKLRSTMRCINTVTGNNCMHERYTQDEMYTAHSPGTTQLQAQNCAMRVVQEVMFYLRGNRIKELSPRKRIVLVAEPETKATYTY